MSEHRTMLRNVTRTATETYTPSPAIKDPVGLVLGLEISSGICDFVEAPASQRAGCFDMAPGRYHYIVVRPTKDGRTHGAPKPMRLFQTTEETETYIQECKQDLQPE